eukprot:SAG25_NODE_14652_length_252_cov_0.699346_1_plen_43_part_01
MEALGGLRQMNPVCFRHRVGLFVESRRRGSPALDAFDTGSYLF